MPHAPRAVSARRVRIHCVRVDIDFHDNMTQLSYLTGSQRGCLTPMNNFSVVARSYNVSHLDSAIDHLEQVLSLESANSLFSKTYWHGRVVQALSTPGLAMSQHTRL
ncbi:hypothetical protein BHUM_04544c [Candidatus Burkholderia humilis]|nr:hypothetical protein BHUM_04544c [Candidatus Burkholderia humilis]